MSSSIGHSLTGIVLYSLDPKPPQKKRDRGLWCWCLIVAACAPDLDYIIPAFHPTNHQGIRITHSLLGCLCFPILVILTLVFIVPNQNNFRKYSGQILAAGLSHLILDLCVGVTALPLLFPWSRQLFKLSFGLLPSAGKIAIANYYFYRNLFIELGVLIPIALLVLVQWRNKYRWFSIPLLFLISGGFMYWSFHLPR